MKLQHFFPANKWIYTSLEQMRHEYLWNGDAISYLFVLTAGIINTFKYIYILMPANVMCGDFYRERAEMDNLCDESHPCLLFHWKSVDQPPQYLPVNLFSPLSPCLLYLPAQKL